MCFGPERHRRVMETRCKQGHWLDHAKQDNFGIRTPREFGRRREHSLRVFRAVKWNQDFSEDRARELRSSRDLGVAKHQDGQ